MSVLTIELDPGLALSLESLARREQKPVALWAKERLKLAAMEDQAVENGYPPGWLKLFGSISDSDSFESPARRSARPVEPIQLGD